MKTRPRESPGVMGRLGVAPCVRLPLAVDADAIAREIAALPEATWSGSGRNVAVQSEVEAFFAFGSRRGRGRRIQGPRPSYDRLPALRRLLGEDVPGELVRVVAARLPAGAFVPLHTDAPRYYGHSLRILLPVASNPHARLCNDGKWYRPPVGEVWAFDNLRPHAAVNDGPRSRIHLLVDLVPDERTVELVRTGVPVAGVADAPAFARLESRSRRRYAATRWDHLGFRILDLAGLR